jgi:hypothetical protein
MSSGLPPQIDRSWLAQNQAATFLERGISLPFTTPMLVGARLRLREREAMELVIKDPSGGMGFYVLPWAALPDMCSPTSHDCRLWDLIVAEPLLSPASIRRAAGQVVREGLAGPAAEAAWSAAEHRCHGDRVRANFMLLVLTIRQNETLAEAVIPPERDHPEQLERRAKRALARVGGLLGIPADDMAACLEEVAVLMQDTGVPGHPEPAHTRRKMIEVEALSRGVAEWSEVTPAARDSPVNDVIIGAAELTLAGCRSILTELDALMADPTALLRRWLNDPVALRQLASRPEWLLDGWDLLCAMWRDAPEEGRLATAGEIARLTPVLPREAERWTRHATTIRREPILLHRRVRAMEDWRTGQMIGSD